MESTIGGNLVNEIAAAAGLQREPDPAIALADCPLAVRPLGRGIAGIGIEVGEQPVEHRLIELIRRGLVELGRKLADSLQSAGGQRRPGAGVIAFGAVELGDGAAAAADDHPVGVALDLQHGIEGAQPGETVGAQLRQIHRLEIDFADAAEPDRQHLLRQRRRGGGGGGDGIGGASGDHEQRGRGQDRSGPKNVPADDHAHEPPSSPKRINRSPRTPGHPTPSAIAADPGCAHQSLNS